MKTETPIETRYTHDFPAHYRKVIADLERENAELRQQLADMKSILFVVQADLEPAGHEPAVLMIGDGIPAALLRAAHKEAQS